MVYLCQFYWCFDSTGLLLSYEILLKKYVYTVKQCDQKTPLKNFYNRQKYTSCSYFLCQFYWCFDSAYILIFERICVHTK